MLKRLGFQLDNDGFYQLKGGSQEDRKMVYEFLVEKVKKLDEIL